MTYKEMLDRVTNMREEFEGLHCQDRPAFTYKVTFKLRDIEDYIHTLHGVETEAKKDKVEKEI